MLRFCRSNKEFNVPIAIGVLFLVLAAAFAAQAHAVFKDRGMIPVLLLGTFEIMIFGALGALEVQQSHLDRGVVLGYWSTTALLFAIELIIGAIAFVAESEGRHDDVPPQTAMLALIGVAIAACTGLYTVA